MCECGSNHNQSHSDQESDFTTIKGGKPFCLHSPDTSDLQLWLCAKLLALDRLIGDNGGSGAAGPHIVKHDTLKEKKSRFSAHGD